MSDDTENVTQISARAKGAIERLKLDALQGNESAIKALIELAVHTTLAVHRLWHETNPRVRNPFAVGYNTDPLGLRKLILREIIEDGMGGLFPILYQIPFPSRWDESLQKIVPPKQQVTSWEIKDQAAMLNDMTSTTKKGRGRDGYCRHLLATMLIPHVDKVRQGLNKGPDYLRSLPPLSRETASRWATAIQKRIWEKKADDVRKEGSDWNWIAGAGRKKLNRKEKTFNATTGKMVKKLLRDLEEGKITARTDSRAANLAKKLADPQAKDRALKDGLYQNLLDGLLWLASTP